MPTTTRACWRSCPGRDCYSLFKPAIDVQFQIGAAPLRDNLVCASVIESGRSSGEVVSGRIARPEGGAMAAVHQQTETTSSGRGVAVGAVQHVPAGSGRVRCLEPYHNREVARPEVEVRVVGLLNVVGRREARERREVVAGVDHGPRERADDLQAAPLVGAIGDGNFHGDVVNDDSLAVRRARAIPVCADAGRCLGGGKLQDDARRCGPGAGCDCVLNVRRQGFNDYAPSISTACADIHRNNVRLADDGSDVLIGARIGCCGPSGDNHFP